MADPKDLLKELICIDSNVNKSNIELIELTKNKLKNLDIQEYSFLKKDLKLFNLVAKINGKSSDNPLVFVAHTDTVPASDKWNSNPLEPIEKDGKIYGLGSSDMKAGIACMLAAALSLEKQPRQDVYLVFDADEEGSGLGALSLIDRFSLANAKIIIAEPTTRKIIIGQKGCIDLEIETFGKAMHSSRTNFEQNHKNNAIYKIARIIQALLNYEKEIEKKEDKEYGKPNMNLGFIQGGNAPTVLADKCVLKISRRLLPSESLDNVFNEISKIVLQEDPEARIKKLFWGESFKTEKNTEFIKNIINISKLFYEDILLDVNKAWTEASLFSKWGETVIFGPGQEEQAHQANESVEISDLDKFTKIYKQLMEGK